ncbi:MAG: AraC family transcriptional regulator ligand-binding domain-containing protein [Sandaracinus sp.]|nr:AraC family transcriptional regulator ligand-binding domain-containing protein [Sandaracinus sp.]MCB9621194.1 AraC family transcriptional regulator ligand-binding domain-containing protein [Sandaracinus sp.]MCB9621979.1 AraC family transcriptional regulator ligand-binding domain-containing protein [Sandaracinus sp.]MCB9632852.1 AraC family transcriptional regulator ligand-binding domain-containing protein [Sandaracinus sp.]
MRTQLVAPLLAYVRSRGGEVAALTASLPVPLPEDAASAPEVVLLLPTFRALFEDAARILDDPFLGVSLAQALPRGTWGILEYACRSAIDVREAARRMARYIGLLNELVTIRFDERSGGIAQSIEGEPHVLGRHANELFVVAVTTQIRRLARPSAQPEGVWLAHPRPGRITGLVDALGTDALHFDAGRNEVRLPRDVLDAPLASADPNLLRLLDAQAEQALALRPREGSRLRGRVRERLVRRLREGTSGTTGLASELGLAPRTLQRQLAAEGTSVRAELEAVREELARAWVVERPLGEIAFLLGYADTHAFARAFKRWTGTTPSRFRA